ncbi:antitoxin Xre/MbcA/ParS toxin-binding domain-containing protein [Pseudomonas sp. Irchel s3b2]|uniref:type II RES/Xre toxin-antitoxin system antitoxin n=1 Tax=Pseudomonas sp. Irchel s3b2 TaxID=2009073 RepID=UPI000BA2CD3A|nr:antitoxin Xre/MbcA/ParS toxin-binding domain-containing protein [Pseudomonas sp. Irchel s3b2]
MNFEYQPSPSVSGSIWETLGLPSRGTRLHDLIHVGLSFELLDQVASLLQMQRADISNALCMSPAMLARRAKTGRFNTAESDRLVALIAVYEEALSLFENDAVAAKKWMNCRVRGLGSRRPLDMLGTRVETNAVLDLIGRLERGVVV